MRSISVLTFAALLVSIAPGPASAHLRAKPSGEITVSAAASLTDAFTALGSRFERRNPNATITFNFGASSTLANQIRAGAPVDVYAAADPTNLEDLGSDVRFTRVPQPFARNEMEIAVKPGNPENVASVADLAEVGTVSLCGEAVPCGIYAATVLEMAEVTIPTSHVTRGADARATLGAVSRGDADAAIVYTTDVAAAGHMVEGVAIPTVENVVAVYPIVALAGSSHSRVARAFVKFVLSQRGQKVLTRHGFLPA